MKVKYSRKEDILLIEVSDEPIEYEVGSIIVHFTKHEKPVLLEILDAGEFLAETAKITMKPESEGKIEAST